MFAGGAFSTAPFSATAGGAVFDSAVDETATATDFDSAAVVDFAVVNSATAVGSDVAYAMSEDDDGGVSLYTGDPVAAAALNYWSLARNVCRPLREVVEADQSYDAPSAGEVIKRIEMYEQAKRLDGRWDFTDLLSRFVGLRFDPVDGPVEVTPEGLAMLSDKNIVPGMPVEVVIKTGERSFMSYLLKPLSDRAARSFKD